MKYISVICSVMNRSDRVYKCIESWLAWSMCDDVVLIDWSSTPPVSEFPDNDKLTTLRVENEKYFSLARSYNKGINASRNDIVVKIDIDYVLTSCDMLTDLIHMNNFNTHFVHGGGHGSNYMGFCIFNKKHNIRYNEQFQGYGFDDQDLYRRLQDTGIKKQKKIANLKDIIYHIPHGNALRVANYQDKYISNSTKQNKKIANDSE